MKQYTNITTFEELYNECINSSQTIWEAAQKREADNAEIPVKEFRAAVKKSLDAMKEAINSGLKSNELSISGMCGDDCARLQEKFAKSHALLGKPLKRLPLTLLQLLKKTLGWEKSLPALLPDLVQ